MKRYNPRVVWDNQGSRRCEYCGKWTKELNCEHCGAPCSDDLADDHLGYTPYNKPYNDPRWRE